MPAPNVNNTYTTFQLGTWNQLTDVFTPVLDLNDRVTWWIEQGGLQLPQPDKVEVRGTNVRTNGESISRVQMKNRHITVSLRTQGASDTAVLANILTLQNTIENLPYVIRYALPGATAYRYADVRTVKHTITVDVMLLLAKAAKGISIDFECSPTLRGDQQWLVNQLVNPGFGAPSQAGVTTFSETFANANAYSVVAGGALGQDKLTYADVTQSLHGQAGSGGTTLGLLRYYRLDEASGTTAYDASSNVANGTISATGVTLGTTGLLTGDTDTAATFASASSGKVTVPTTSLPTGNAAWSLHCLYTTPASFSAPMSLQSFGAQLTKQGPQLYIDATGHAICGTVSADTTGFALSASTTYRIGGTWDGTTLTIYVNGVARFTATPGTLSVPSGGNAFIGCTPSSTNFANGVIDEATFWSGCLTATQMASFNTAATTTPATNTASLQIPAGGTEAFGSPGWGPLVWNLRFRQVSGMTITAYPHYLSATQYVKVTWNGTTLALLYNDGAGEVSLAGVGPHLVPGANYWLTFTQFPNAAGFTVGQSYNNAYSFSPLLQVSLSSDAGGVAGSPIATLGPQCIPANTTFTAMYAGMRLSATGAALGFTLNTVRLFGPGGWLFDASGGTGLASGAWEQYIPNTYPGGPVTSIGAARVDVAPAGTLDAKWQVYQGSALTSGAAPTANNAVWVNYFSNSKTMAVSAWVNATGLSATARVSILVSEYSVTGALQRTTTVGSQALTGSPSGWVQLSGTVTTGTLCSVIDVALRVTDTVAAASAGATVWWDNAQCWNVTDTGQTTMPYCELNFASSPAHLVVSGIAGTVAAPCVLHVGTRPPGGQLAAGGTLTLVAGRRALHGVAAPLVGMAGVINGAAAVNQQAIDATAFGGVQAQYQNPATANFEPFFFTGTAANYSGIYHLLTRSRVIDAGFASDTVQAVAYLLQNPWLGQYATKLDRLGVYQGPISLPWTATNTWTLLDTGQITLPPFALSGQADPTKLYTTAAALFPTSAGEVDTDWGMLLPVDSDVVSARFANNTSGVALPGYIWQSFNGLDANPSVAWSLESGYLPNPGHAGGGFGLLSDLTPSLDSYGTPIPHVDPTIGGGVNQWAVALLDGAVNMVPVQVMIRYAPLYLY